MELKLTCPVHPDVVLFVEHMDRFELIVFGQTKRCPKCGKSYFKEQCQSTAQVTRGDDDELEG